MSEAIENLSITHPTKHGQPQSKVGKFWPFVALSSSLLVLTGCSGNQSSAALAASSKIPKSHLVPQASVSKTTGSTGLYSTAAMDTAVDQMLLMPYLDDSQFVDSDVLVSDLGQNTQDGVIWDRLRGGFALSLDEPQSISRELDALSPRFIERSLAQSSEYLYLVLDEVERRGLPVEIALLPLVESGYNPAAVSPGKAAGLWQFLPQTARNFGLKLTHGYDGRHDVLASTKAALDYLEHLGDMFGGDWLLALTAYNTGEGTLQRWIQHNRRQGKSTHFKDLPIPPETRRYIPRLMAMRAVIENPGRYGVELPVIPNRPVLDTVDVQGRLGLAEAADLADLSLSQVLHYNPAIQAQHHAVLPGTLLLPTAYAHQLKQRLRDSEARPFDHDLADSPEDRQNLIQEAQRVLVETPVQTKSPLAKTYVVRTGDSLYTIAKAHRVDSTDLARWNKLTTKATLKIGQTLKVQNPLDVASASPTSTASNAVTYLVRAGDSLSSIAQKFSVSVADLSLWNAVEPHHTLRPGQRLTIRKSTPGRRAQS